MLRDERRFDKVLLDTRQAADVVRGEGGSASSVLAGSGHGCKRPGGL